MSIKRSIFYWRRLHLFRSIHDDKLYVELFDCQVWPWWRRWDRFLRAKP